MILVWTALFIFGLFLIASLPLFIYIPIIALVFFISSIDFGKDSDA